MSNIPFSHFPWYRHSPVKLGQPLVLFVAVGTDLDLFWIQVQGIGPNLFSIPGRVVDIQDFRAGDLVHRVVEAGVLGGGMGMAGYPKQDLRIFF